MTKLQVWEEMKEILQQNMSKNDYDLYFRLAEPIYLDLENKVLALEVYGVNVDECKKNYQEQLSDAITNVMGEKYRAEICLCEDNAKNLKKIHEKIHEGLEILFP